MSLDLAKAKADLEKLRDEYSMRIEKISDHMQHPQEEMVEDWDDQALVTSQNDMRTLLKDEAEQGLVMVNAALSRIENGTYGVCAECGEDIEEKRMQAVPYASMCMAHAK